MRALPRWDSDYPDPTMLRAEVEAMTRACVEELLAALPGSEIERISLKGSSIKAWSTPLDYVPEISDIDLHVLFRDVEAAHEHLDTVSQGLRFLTGVERRYGEAVVAPVHLPRFRVIVTNELQQQPDYMPSPPGAEIVVLDRRPSAARDRAKSGPGRASQQILETYVGPLLPTLGRHVADKPGKHLWTFVRGLSWRVSPTGPLALEILGTPFDGAWSLNRTGVIRRLEELGETDLARSYAAFYVSAWEGFLSEFRDVEAAHRAAEAAGLVLERATTLARTGPAI